VFAGKKKLQYSDSQILKKSFVISVEGDAEFACVIEKSIGTPILAKVGSDVLLATTNSLNSFKSFTTSSSLPS
jgi:hypothetical protein